MVSMLSTVYSTMKSMLERHDPGTCVALNIDAIRQLAQTHSDIGRYVVVDGTDFAAPVEQRPAHSPSEERLLHGDLGIRRHSHGPAKNWVGWTLLCLTDIKSTLPLAWTLLPLGSGREFLGVLPLVELLLEHWPECPIEFLVGDKEFDVEELNSELEFRYGIHPVTNLRGGQVGGGHQWGPPAAFLNAASTGS